MQTNVGFACAATVGILKSALKSNAPTNRAIVKHVKIDEIIEIVEYGVAESAPWHKQYPLSGGDYNNAVGKQNGCSPWCGI